MLKLLSSFIFFCFLRNLATLKHFFILVEHDNLNASKSKL